MRRAAAAAVLGATLALAAPAAADREVEIHSLEDGDRIARELGYTNEVWDAGIRNIPRLYITGVTSKWRDEWAKQVTVAKKKDVFFRALAPLVLHANELIVENRTHLALFVDERTFETASQLDRDWLIDLALDYKVIASAEMPIDDAVIAELWVRCDIVPPSLALAQSAEESGWGTSRFAAEGNALFGQWAFDGNGITPKDQRAELGNYKIAAFETPLASVLAYMRNLNTHRAYQALRDKRAEIRAAGRKPTGKDLVDTLTKYSERGADYVKSLRAIMRVNHLHEADGAWLVGEAIYMVPGKPDV